MLFSSGGFDFIFTCMFLLIFGMIAINIIRGIGEWHQNNQSPRLTVDAYIVSKRTNVSRHHHADAGNVGGGHTTTSTTYYVTFQVASGDRMEFSVRGQEYGLLVEGDRGQLMFQGTRYLGFQRYS
ncbi:MAG: DUF2500 domain-containing protein [bacterium]|nr:DUF2500 domain-containing protein [bacterium]